MSKQGDILAKFNAFVEGRGGEGVTPPTQEADTLGVPAPEEGPTDILSRFNAFADAYPTTPPEVVEPTDDPGIVASLTQRLANIFSREEQKPELTGPPSIDTAATEAAFADVGAPVPALGQSEQQVTGVLGEGAPDPARMLVRPDVIPDLPAPPPMAEPAVIGDLSQAEVEHQRINEQVSEEANAAFRAQPMPKRLLQVATTGLRDAPGILGAIGRSVKPDDTMVEKLIEHGVIELGSGEQGLKVVSMFAPPILEVLMVKSLARSVAPKAGPAGKLFSMIGRKTAGSRAGGALTGALEGIPTDLAMSIENADFLDAGLGTGIGAIAGYIFPGAGAIAPELKELIDTDPKAATEALVHLLKAGEEPLAIGAGPKPLAIGAGPKIAGLLGPGELRTQMDVALARAYADSDSKVVAVLDDVLATPTRTLDTTPKVSDEFVRKMDPNPPDPPRTDVLEPRPDASMPTDPDAMPTALQAGVRNARERVTPDIDVPDVPRTSPRDPDAIGDAARTDLEPGPARRVDTEGRAGAPEETTFVSEVDGGVRAILDADGNPVPRPPEQPPVEPRSQPRPDADPQTDLFDDFANESGFLTQDMARLVGAPLGLGAVGAALGAGTAQDPKDALGRANLGLGFGLAAGLGAPAARALGTTKWGRKYLTSGGVLVGGIKSVAPQAARNVRDALGALRGEAAEADRIARQALADVGSAVNTLYGGPGRARVILGNANPFDAMPADVLATVSDFMHGAQHRLADLPKELQEPIGTMRKVVDKYSRMFEKEGIVEGELAVTFNKRLGAHLTRSYRVFDDPNWAKNAPKAVGEEQWERTKNQFKRWYREEFDDLALSDDEMERVLEDFLAVGDSLNPLRAIASGRLGKLNANVLARRKSVPFEVRQLWGETTDPRVNFVRTITNQAYYLSNYRFLKRLRQEGLGEGFFWDPASGGLRPEGFTAEIASKGVVNSKGETIKGGSTALKPLAGLRTTPEIAEAFHRQWAGTPRIENMFIRLPLAIFSATKVAKTVLSQSTQIRNLSGNFFIAHAQGYTLRPRTMADGSVRTIDAMLAGSGWRGPGKSRDFFNEAVRLGVLDDSARAAELDNALQNSLGRMHDTPLGEWVERGGLPKPVKGAVRVARMMKNAPFGLYRAGDDVWKLMGWTVEQARYREAFPDWTEQQVKEKAASVVRQVWPTFSQTPELVNQARRVGGFLSFPSEVFRSMHGSMRLIQEEWANKATRHIAAERIAGHLSGVAGGAASIAAASRGIHNITSEEEDAVREFQPPWSRNSTMVHLRKPEDGVFQVVDLSYTDPYAYLQKPLLAFMRGEDWQTTAAQVVKELADPWLSPNPLASEVVEQLIRADDQEEAVAGFTDAVLSSLTPSAITQWAKVVTGRSSSLRDVNKGTELTSLLTGLRGDKRDIRETLSITASGFTTKLTRAGKELRLAEARGGVVSRWGDQERAMDKLREGTLDDQVEVFEEMTRKIRAASVLGMADAEIAGILRGAHISKKNVQFLMSQAVR